MKRSTLLLVVALAMAASSFVAFAQNSAPAEQSGNPSPAAATAIQTRVENILRNLYAWGSDIEIQAGPTSPSPIPGLYQVPVKVTTQGGSDTAIVYVSRDGRYMFRGEMQDLDSDPLAVTRSALHLDGYASKGPPDAKVTVVEFADFQCPSCRQLAYILRAILPKYPQVRFVFKDFPLDQIHPWATTAAIAGHCALRQSQDIFWKFHDSVYDSQDLISAENASVKLAELAAAAGADPSAYQSCMVDPETAEKVKSSAEEGRALQLTGTPTMFVNGRRIVGPNQNLLQQYIQFDLSPEADSTILP